jgi:hypothetical protein
MPKRDMLLPPCVEPPFKVATDDIARSSSDGGRCSQDGCDRRHTVCCDEIWLAIELWV